MTDPHFGAVPRGAAGKDSTVPRADAWPLRSSGPVRRAHAGRVPGQVRQPRPAPGTAVWGRATARAGPARRCRGGPLPAPDGPSIERGMRTSSHSPLGHRDHPWDHARTSRSDLKDDTAKTRRYIPTLAQEVSRENRASASELTLRCEATRVLVLASRSLLVDMGIRQRRRNDITGGFRVNPKRGWLARTSPGSMGEGQEPGRSAKQEPEAGNRARLAAAALREHGTTATVGSGAKTGRWR